MPAHKIHPRGMQVITLRVPTELREALERYADERGVKLNKAGTEILNLALNEGPRTASTAGGTTHRRFPDERNQV